MAQDFHAAFSLGADDKHIATVDADGVALTAIQGLNQKMASENARSRGELQTGHSQILALQERLARRERLLSSSPGTQNRNP